MPRLLSIGKVSEPMRSSGWHVHPAWEVCLVTAGDGTLLVGDAPIRFRPGTIIFSPPNVPHEAQSDAGCLMYFMLIDGYQCDPLPVPVFTDSPNRICIRLAEQLQQECQLREAGWEHFAQQLLQILLAYIDRWRGADHHPHVARLKHLIMQGMSRHDFSVGHAMESLPISKDHLRRQFIESTGMTPMQFLTHMRVDEAKRLLRVMNVGVKEASWMAGFADPAYFARVFRRQTGFRPSDFISATPPGYCEPELHHVQTDLDVANSPPVRLAR